MNTNGKPKVMVIGLDGATWTNLRPWMEQGLLPNLKFLVDNGASGKLESTIPRHSAAAWTSFMTGVNPGKHGVFGFIKPFKDKHYTKEIISSRDIKVKTIFEILSDYDKTSGVINLPITYPPLKIKGFMLSCGLTTPNINSNFTHPEDLFEQINFEKDDYILSVRWPCYSESEKNEFFYDLTRCEEIKKEISFKLMNKYDCDLFMVVFGGTDWLQHFCWHYIDPTHTKYNPIEAQKFIPSIIKYYQKLDSIIGDFIKRMDENTSLLIMSDHGFGPREKKIAFHKLLEEAGYLHYKIEPFSTRLRGYLHKNSLIYRKMKAILKYIYSKIKNISDRKTIVKKYLNRKMTGDLESEYLMQIDWKKTFSYSGYPDDTVYLNIQGRDPEGIITSDAEYQKIREKIIDLITNLSNPETGHKLNVKAYKKEQIYSGPFLNDGYDLFFEIEDEKYDLRSGAKAKHIFNENPGSTGKHTKNGIIICYGNNFKKAQCINDSGILDISATILYLLGMPLPTYLDGKVLKEAIKNEHLIKNQVKYQSKIDDSKKNIQRNDSKEKEDTSQIEQRLADLGYI